VKRESAAIRFHVVFAFEAIGKKLEKRRMIEMRRKMEMESQM
jgi:hypothetical protein